MKLCSLREVVRAGWDLNATSIQFNFPPSTWIIILWLRLEHQYRTLQLRWWSWHNCRIIIYDVFFISPTLSFKNKSIFLSCVAGGNWGDLGARILRCQKSFCATLHTTQTCHYWYFTYKYGWLFFGNLLKVEGGIINPKIYGAGFWCSKCIIYKYKFGKTDNSYCWHVKSSLWGLIENKKIVLIIPDNNNTR